MASVVDSLTSSMELRAKPGEWLEKHWSQCFYWIAAYLLFVTWGQAFMQKREAFKLKKWLIVWNAFLAGFSIIGTIRIFPEFYFTLQRYGFKKSYCFVGSLYDGTHGYWIVLFHLSKLLELGDTVFLVLRKRPVIFLHWYHHAVVLLYSWYAYGYFSASIRWSVFMNILVHSFMYSYYFLRSVGCRLPLLVAPCITSMQLMQFVVGSYISVDVFYRVTFTSEPCDSNPIIAGMQLFLYINFLVLFSEFFYRSYVSNAKVKNE
ncbi:unnamed protein product [Soboliphyme baturini]|uniref:Elongation of very long chain fatty acids protein n=1 Tax=Soboliphyme baturini TaxID=241478 RepID=A0A183ID22_9BILA|nr:unnamed protein product [Soboliphyme baturini]